MQIDGKTSSAIRVLILSLKELLKENNQDIESNEAYNNLLTVFISKGLYEAYDGIRKYLELDKETSVRLFGKCCADLLLDIAKEDVKEVH